MSFIPLCRLNFLLSCGARHNEFQDVIYAVSLELDVTSLILQLSDSELVPSCCSRLLVAICKGRHAQKLGEGKSTF